MLIQTFPPRRMCLVIAIRAASICRLVTYECSTAWMPYSPKVTRVPPLAAPERSGRCCLRCLTLRGMSMSSALLARARGGGRGDGRLGGVLARVVLAVLAVGAATAVAAPWPPALRRPAVAGALAGPQRGRRGLALGAGLRGLAAVDPHLHADPAEGRPGLVEAVVDVGAERVQRHPPFAVELRPRHFRAAQPARALDPDPLGAALHRGLHGLAHRAPERDPAGQLLRHALGDQLGVHLRVLHL